MFGRQKAKSACSFFERVEHFGKSAFAEERIWIAVN